MRRQGPSHHTASCSPGPGVSVSARMGVPGQIPPQVALHCAIALVRVLTPQAADHSVHWVNVRTPFVGQQVYVGHGWTSISMEPGVLPLQLVLGSPPQEAAWHERVREKVPVPQVAEHGPKLPHEDQVAGVGQHTSVLQLRMVVCLSPAADEPQRVLPPFSAAMHVRSPGTVPPPHVAEQVPVGAHSDHAASTGQGGRLSHGMSDTELPSQEVSPPQLAA
jgi:hypothetical protein